jgi:uncharacterized NAD(P)/FAD-binding protein YdhS
MKDRAHSDRAFRIAIVGGGFGGASLAVQLVRQTTRPLDVTIFEPREQLGAGIAYSTVDPHHRLNAPAFAHTILPEDFLHFTRWANTAGLPSTDPAALQPDGTAYYRRSDFGTYVSQTVAEHAHSPATGSRIAHVRDQVTDLQQLASGQRVQTQRHGAQDFDMVFIATGNALPRLPGQLSRHWGDHPAVIENPFAPGRLQAIPREATVLVIGSGLTALDALSTLLAQGHTGPVTVMSRRGLKPHLQGPTPAAVLQVLALADAGNAVPGRVFLDRIMGPVPAFLDMERPGLRRWLRDLRRQIGIDVQSGGTWHSSFDMLRDTVWQLWPRLSVRDRRRFLETLKPWYDVHRFRSPPQNAALVGAAVERGQVRFQTARLVSLDASQRDKRLQAVLRQRGAPGETQFHADALVNCSGLDAAAGMAANPLLHALVTKGTVRADACNAGLAIDADGRAITADGRTSRSLRVIGPATFGTFGDPIGAFFIASQILRFLPAVFHDLEEIG